MPTKLSRFAEGLMEAAWLAAVVLTPLFFNIYSSRIFEPEKLALLRSLALVILACWLMILIEKGMPGNERLKKGLEGWKTWLRQPLTIPAITLAAITILSTIFSVTPAISLWGSYPRLQGAYTTLSYLIIFAALVVHLKRKEQADRLVGVIILSSLPVSLYGILQRYGLDPIPWGGDVSQRIASNLGNSIFVAAYLIMVFPLTIMRIVDSFEDLLNDEGSQVANFARSVSYIFIGALQVIAIYFSGSRGPWLGWAASLVVIWLGLSLVWRKRWLTATGVILAVATGTFLILLNISGGPLESLRNRPEFGRLGQLLDAESRTGKVRTLIWQGAAELVTPHDPLEYPDGRLDSWNAIRPLIGYGPEAMYVAYNRFYPPELALVEKRNASPDRSHNETWDALVTTGLAGLVVYLLLFGLVIYYALMGLGFVRTKRQKQLFLVFYLLGGAISLLVFLPWQGIAYLGVALPFGMLLGVIGYLLISSVAGWFEPVTTAAGRMRAYLLLGLLAAIIAHFMEINFGIAISATRTYFWVYAALIILVGYKLPQEENLQEERSGSSVKGLWDVIPESEKAKKADKLFAGRILTDKPESKQNTSAKKKNRRASKVEEKRRVINPLIIDITMLGLILAIPMLTLGYNYLTNNQRAMSVWKVVWDALTFIKGTNQSSFGIFALVLTSWLAGGVILAAEHQLYQPGQNKSGFFKMWFGVLAISGVIAGIYWFIQAGNLVAMAKTQASNLEDVLRQVKMSESLLGDFYLFLLIILVLLGFVLAYRQPGSPKASRLLAGVPALGVLIIVLILAAFTNLRIVQADVAFKAAELFAQPNSWPVAIAIYQRANSLAPNEDYYYLFLGRAYLEHAKSIPQEGERDQLIAQAAEDLQKAQALNPLNTDHTANLARLYNVWASNTTDPALAAERAMEAEEYFSKALRLSPNNARLWDEWAMLYLNLLNQPEKAYERIQTALNLDSSYDWSYALLGDYYNRKAATSQEDGSSKNEALLNAAQAYQNALMKAGSENPQLRFSYALALGSIQLQLRQFATAHETLVLALSLAQPEDQWRALEALALLSLNQGERDLAEDYINQALAVAPQDAQEQLRQWLAEITE